MAGKNITYTVDVADALCSRMAGGRTLKDICERDNDMPCMATVRRWAMDDTAGFRAKFILADGLKLVTWADDIIEIADDARNDWMERERKDGTIELVVNGEHIQRSKLRIETKKWLMRVLKPELYSEKSTVEHSGPGGGPIEVMVMTELERARRVAFMVHTGKLVVDAEDSGDGNPERVAEPVPQAAAQLLEPTSDTEAKL
jgi:hypothetical protein